MTEKLTAAEAIQKVIARDMESDPEWQLTQGGRHLLSRVLHQLEAKEGRSR